MLLLSVYDKEANNYQQCFTKHTLPEATREFILACRNPDGMFRQFPEQFELHQLAEITPEGKFVNTDKSVVITADNVMQMESIAEKNLPENLQNSAS